MERYDVTVIGGGPGGYVAAIRAAQRGAAVALVEMEDLGGVCLNWGCIPTKTLIASAELYSSILDAGAFGIAVSGEATVDWPAMIQRRDRVVSGLRQGTGALLKSNGVTTLKGRASFVDRQRVQVRGPEGTRKLRTSSTVIATGGAPVIPGFLPKSDRVITSRQALALQSLPARIIILGGGVIGSEFACLYARLGVEVTLVEMLPGILPMADPEAARVVSRQMRKLGIQVKTEATMTGVVEEDDGLTAEVDGDALRSDALLVCVGRRPTTDGLNLEAAGLDTDESGAIPVNDQCHTGAPGIYAIGDVTGGIQLAHRASAMGICAAENATGGRRTHSDALVPSCIFTSPEIGSVGLTEAQATEKGYTVKVGRFPFAALGKAHALGAVSGLTKIITECDTGQILGIHIVGPHATDLISEGVLAMNLEATAEEIGRAIHPHPTLGEALFECAHDVQGSCIHLPKRRR